MSFNLSGNTNIGGPPKPTASLGRLVFDGSGNLTGTASAMFDGYLLGNPVTGTYQAQTDCTVIWKLQDDSGGFQNFAGQLSPDGTSVQFRQSDPGGAARGIMKKIAGQCSAKDLMTTYSFTASGSTTPMLEGHVERALSAKGTLDVADNGSFEVETDCSVKFQLPMLNRVGESVETSKMNMRGYLVNGGKEILAFQTDPGAMVVAHLTTDQPSNSR